MQRRRSGRSPSMKTVLIGCLMLTLTCGGSAFAAQVKDEGKKAGSAAKEAGKETGSAAKHAGKATVNATKKGAKTVKKAVTGDAHATCIDGTRQAGATEADAAAACASHGG